MRILDRILGVGLDLFLDQVSHPDFSPWRRSCGIGRTLAVREYDREISQKTQPLNKLSIVKLFRPSSWIKQALTSISRKRGAYCHEANLTLF